MDALTNFFLDKNCEYILDVGTGQGNFIPVLKVAFPNAKIVGIDPVIESLTEAKINHPDVQFLQGKAERLPFKEGTFDVVSISLALHHLTKVSKGLREIKRVVKNDGWIIINEIISDDLNPAQEVQKIYHHFRSRIDRILGISHHETFKKDQVIQMVEEVGISIRFYFEHKVEPKELEENEIEKKVEIMQKKLDNIKGKPEYEEMKGLITEFKKQAVIYGFQPATNLVIVGRK